MVEEQERPLRQVTQANSILELVGRLAPEERLALCRLLQPQGEADEGGLSTSIGAGDAHELAHGDVEVDPFDDGRAAGIRERQVSKRDR